MQQFFFGDRNPGLEKLLIDLFVLVMVFCLPPPPTSNPAIKKKPKSDLIMTKTLKNDTLVTRATVLSDQSFQSWHNHTWLVFFFLGLLKTRWPWLHKHKAWRRRYLLIGVKIIDVMNVRRNQTGSGGSLRGRNHGVRHRRGENQWHC